MGKHSPIVRKYGTSASSSLIARLRQRSDEEVSKGLKPYIEEVIGQDIRKVICYDENLTYSGYCETCTFSEMVVDIYFKSIEGRLCKFRFQGTMSDLIFVLNKKQSQVGR